MKHGRAVVVGATGLIGQRLTDHLQQTGAWDLLGLCRNADRASPIPLLSVDLTDAEGCRRALAALDDVTHVFYTARFDHPEGIHESVEINAAMLRNVVDAISAASPRLVHVHAVHGTKYYGHNFGPIPVPAGEDSPRATRTNFYFPQEDYLREHSGARRWTWSTSRPHIFCDDSPGTPRNLPLLVATYASVLREAGEPLYFPGTEASYRARTQFTELSMLSRAIEWMATTPACANQAFNVVNGDYPRWSDLWPVFAGYFGMQTGPVVPANLRDMMAPRAAQWNAIVERHGLRPSSLATSVLWEYGDYVFRPEWDIVSDMAKARRYGFTEQLDSARRFTSLFDRMREQRVIP
jgi:nucleoside-diphosphate-sugar epimerase